MGEFLKPETSQRFGFYDGNRIAAQSQALRLAYYAGAYDALKAVAWEQVTIANSVIPPTAANMTLAEWAEADTSTRLRIAGGVAVSRLTAALLFIPQETTLGQIADVVDAYIASHPTERHNNAALLLWRALAEATFKWR
ncbi:Rap1a/Tai family immunity protein [Geochorda subterranea]|uniref:Rap1a/Tai family immunity protein n=1 Tax=Geochorda subterranea TaxID=3109564 RepID=A0ABZ1BQA7_9FIRM|nr:Rap1a/Tai family immunity protein [Limnochorda sp. LNt]WRP14596.1 Rap1a/Tai family immunity protein [Limnochorda sp. LNt]